MAGSESDHLLLWRPDFPVFAAVQHLNHHAVLPDQVFPLNCSHPWHPHVITLYSTFFDRASVGAAAGGLLFFLAYAPYLYIAVSMNIPILSSWRIDLVFTAKQTDYKSLDMSGKGGVCLLSPTCAGIGAFIIAEFEARGEGIQISNLSSQPSDGDDFSMARVFGMLILDIILYGLLTWYVVLSIYISMISCILFVKGTLMLSSLASLECRESGISSCKSRIG
jgi:hypothetical protein